jgi:hypothetical protein
MTDDEFFQRALEWRGIETPCTRCHGTGRIAYGSGSTWRGGIGGSTITPDVCNRCWGTGDEHNHGENLKKLYARLRS